MAIPNTTIPSSEPNPEAPTTNQQLGVVARGAGLAFIGQVALLGLGFVFQFLLARLLGAVNVGVFALALSLVTIVSSLAMLGLNTGVLRFVARFNGLKDYAAAAGSILAGIGLVAFASTTMAVGLFFSAEWIADTVYSNSAVAPVLRTLSISIPFLAVGAVFFAVPQALKQLIYPVVIEKILQPTLRIAGLLIVVGVLSWSVVGVAWAMVFAGMVTCVGGGIVVAYLYRQKYASQRPTFPIKALLLFSWPLLFMDALLRAMSETQTIVLGMFTSSEQVGIYFIALRISGLLTVFLIAFGSIFSPVMAEVHAQGNVSRLGELFKVVTRWGVSLSLPVFLFLFLFAESMLLFFGEDFGAGALTLRILLLAQLINVGVGSTGWMLVMTGYPRWNLLNAILTLIFSVIFAFLLVPSWGIWGAAVGFLGSMTLVNAIRLVQIQIFVGINPFERDYLKPLLAALVAGLVGYGGYWVLSDAALWVQMMGCLALIVGAFFVTLFLAGFTDSDYLVLRKIPILSQFL